MSRKQANEKILEILSKAVEEYPNYRFHQILWALGMTERKEDGLSMEIEDKFYEESTETLKHLEEIMTVSEKCKANN